MTSFESISAAEWKSKLAAQKSMGFTRFEWLTATHNLGIEFEVSARLARPDLSEAMILSCLIECAELESVTEVFPIADFHEREVRQMFGINFLGNENSRLAFETDFQGFPLRRDFALDTRIETQWPGAVEPDESARRRPALAPGVFAEWQK
jgi:NADH-quinone oxidoreductase subunit C